MCRLVASGTQDQAFLESDILLLGAVSDDLVDSAAYRATVPVPTQFRSSYLTFTKSGLLPLSLYFCQMYE